MNKKKRKRIEENYLGELIRSSRRVEHNPTRTIESKREKLREKHRKGDMNED